MYILYSEIVTSVIRRRIYCIFVVASYYIVKDSIPVVHVYKKVSKGAKIRNRYNQVPHLTQDTTGKVTNLHLDTTNESQEVSPFPAGDHKAQTNRRTQRHNNHKRSALSQQVTTRYKINRRTQMHNYHKTEKT